jgi:phage baseplate assembly protein gpV
MKWKAAAAVVLAAAFGMSVWAHADKKAPAGSVLISDKGKLNILIDGKSIGREEFEITPNGNTWIAKGVTKVSMEGSPETTVTGSLTLQPDGSPVSYDWTSQADKTNGAHIVFENGIAKMTLQMQGAHAYEQDLSFNTPHIAVLDNNLYHQYAVLAHLYDWNRKGPQGFLVLIPQELTPGTITVESVGSVSAGGKSYEGLKVVTTDIEMVLYLDANHKLMRLEVPASKAAVVRE